MTNAHKIHVIWLYTEELEKSLKLDGKYSNVSSEETTKPNSYIVVTPARNEEKMLPGLAADMINQSVKPVVWVLADDGSSDKTWLIIKDLEKEFPWIRGVRLKSNNEKIFAHQRNRENVKKGLELAIEICRKHNYYYRYLAVVDADVRLERNYFGKIIKAFQSNPRLGVAHGFVYEKGISLKELHESNRTPRGCGQVIRKECYEMMGGYQGDTLSNVKAKNRNWQIETFASIRIFHRRRTGSGKNYYSSHGKYAYFINYHPINALLTGIYIMAKLSLREGVSYLSGYCGSLVLRQEKIQDDEIKEYYWNSFLRLLWHLQEKL